MAKYTPKDLTDLMIDLKEARFSRAKLFFLTGKIIPDGTPLYEFGKKELLRERGVLRT